MDLQHALQVISALARKVGAMQKESLGRRDLLVQTKSSGIDLVTEGILTMTKAIEYINAARGDYTRLTTEIDAASMLALEIMYADDLYFLVGQQINPFYQNPLLPISISIRKNVVEQFARVLRDLHKDVTIEYC